MLQVPFFSPLITGLFMASSVNVTQRYCQLMFMEYMEHQGKTQYLLVLPVPKWNSSLSVKSKFFFIANELEWCITDHKHYEISSNHTTR